MQSPIFLQPVLQERIWGGTAMESFGYELPSVRTGECWGISAHPNGLSIVSEGRYKGRTLEQLWLENQELFGHYPSKKFPLLTKVLDATTDLSVQVHPDDKFAYENESGGFGKTECWYVIDCEKDAEIVYGHTARTKQEFQTMVKNGEWNSLLRRVPIKPGDFFYVPSGTIHAICKGTLILETQQSSDTTYRVYDYERLDDNGEKRELHLDKALAVSSIPHEDTMWNIKKVTENGVTITTYIQGEYFSVYKWEIHKEAFFKQDKPFQLVSVIEGTGMFKTAGGEFSIQKGGHFILPYDMGEFIIEGAVQLIVSHP
ncbi:mannose-6-phosphate isomerase, class I [Ectobacillus ponti]|uniref:Mannose-6-phosphate isomerase n=1 Tax=Ectobacillus ponti TaxID=2961894 RepID=A0AA41X747_9BACI|nr:mannose-6-phosphate isomerase, class I [Ectobacillus ponti]MCP8967849.1 mannose-6-phosphate isomerase, class I [Ectobacillus ponti]